MLRKQLVNLSLVVVLFGFPGRSFANNGDTGAATVYKVTIEKFEMYNGASWVTVSNGNSTTIDIASVNAGSAAGTFFAGLSVPDGSYTQVRVTIANSFTVSGSVGSDGTPIYTTAALNNGACVSSASAGDQAQCTVSVSGGLPAPTPDTLPSTLTIAGGVPSHKIRVNFNVSNAVQESAGATIVPASPTVTMEMIAL